VASDARLAADASRGAIAVPASPAAVIAFEPLSPESLRPLLGPQEPPCLSLYLPTHRNVPASTVDRPAYRHLLEAFELALGLSHSQSEIDRLLHPLRMLEADHHFWQHTRDGLAVLAAGGVAHGFLLQRPVEPLAVVTKRFHLLPLVRLLAALERLTILTLTSREAAAYEATAWAHVAGSAAARDVTVGPLDPLPLRAGPAAEPATTLRRDLVIDEEIHEPHRVHVGTGPSGRAAVRVIHGGAGSKQDDIDDDTESFLRQVDAVVEAQVSRPTGLPLVLVAAAPLAATFRGLSTNPLLLEEHVPRDPHLMSREAVAAVVAPVFAAAHARRIARELATFRQAHDHGLVADDLVAVGQAAVAGRVATLLVESDRFVPGTFDAATGRITGDGEPPGDLSRTGHLPAATTPDVLGALAEAVLLHGGTIVSLSPAAMPVPSPAAAVLRY
jgi:hypothetical protein